MSKIIGVTVGTPTSPNKMGQELKPVKTINGQTPDKNGNVAFDYATKQYVQEYAQPKGEYLTEHQDISGKLDSAELPKAVNAALAQAKASGEFKGEKGEPGEQGVQGIQGEKGDTGATGPQGPKGEQGIQGPAGAKGDKGDKGDTGDTGPQGPKGEQGLPGADGAKGDKGDKGDTGATGAKGADGAAGYTPVKGVDYFTDADKSELVNMVIAQLGGSPIFGVVDENNNIILNGNLPDGTYSIKYEMEDGSTIDIGNMVLDSNVYYSVTNNLTNCTNSNSAIEVVGGESYSATISANSGYELSSVVVTMGGTDITSSAVSGGTISIVNVTGNIVITAVATETVVTPTYTNLLPLSVDANGNDYKGTNGEDGYKDGYKISVSSGGESSSSGYKVTGFIPVKFGDTIYFKGISFESSGTNTNYCFYDSNKSRIAGGNFYQIFPSGVNGEKVSTVINSSTPLNQVVGSISDVAYIRFSASAMDGNSIVTVNQDIV